MQSVDFHPGPRIVFGPNSIKRLGALAAELGGRNVLVVSDAHIADAGHVKRAVKSLDAAGLHARTFLDVEENPTTCHVQAGVAFAREGQVDLIVGLGGGSAMDCARGINFILTNGGRMADYWGVGKAAKAMLPMIGVPTTAGTGSEVQSFALIADDESHQKMACGDKKASCRVAILDPTLTLTQPANVAATAGMDAIAHAIESYVSRRHTALSRMFAREAWRTLYHSYPKMMADPDELEARGGMQLGAALAGMAIENSMLGAAHSCANPLTAHFGITHGIAVAVMLPHVIRFNASGAGEAYGELLMATCDAYPDSRDVGSEMANVVRTLMGAGELPMSLDTVGVDERALPDLAAEAATQWTAQFNPRPVTQADLLALYRQAYSMSQLNRSR